MSETNGSNQSSQRTSKNQYPDKYRPKETKVENPVLATDNENFEIKNIDLPNEFARDYIGYNVHMNKLSDSTVASYISMLKETLGFLEHARGSSLLDTTKQDLEIYISYCINEQRNRYSTLESKLGTFGELIAHVHVRCNPDQSPSVTPVEIEHIDLDEYNGIPETIEREPLTREEVQILLEQSVGYYPGRTRIIIRVLYETGMRNSDLRNLKLDDIDLDNKVIHIEDSKGGIDYVAPIRADLVLSIRHWLKTGRPAMLGDRTSEYLIPSAQGERLKTRGALTDIVRKAGEEAGIQEQLSTGTNHTLYKVTPHALRHSIVTHLDNNSMDEDLLQILLGHKSRQSQEPYRHGNPVEEQHEQIRTTLHHL